MNITPYCRGLQGDEGVGHLVILSDFGHGLNYEVNSIIEQNFLLMVVSSTVQEVVMELKLPLNMEEDFGVASFWFFPGEAQRCALRKRARGVPEETDPGIDFVTIPFFFFTNHGFVLFDFGLSHASAAPKVLRFPAVVLLL